MILRYRDLSEYWTNIFLDNNFREVSREKLDKVMWDLNPVMNLDDQIRIKSIKVKRKIEEMLRNGKTGI